MLETHWCQHIQSVVSKVDFDGVPGEGVGYGGHALVAAVRHGTLGGRDTVTTPRTGQEAWRVVIQDQKP